MKNIFTLFLLLFSASFSYGQRVNYPPAPSSVYAPSTQIASDQLKSTLWSNDISDPSDWNFANTSVPLKDWSIETDPELISVSGPFQSSSASNGYLAFISDTSQGAIADAYTEYVGAQIDLTGEANIRIQFEQQYISDSNQRILEVSPDGITWTPFLISDGVSPTAAKEDDLTSIDISIAAGNAADLHFRFHFSGSQEGYWAIDDIKICSIDSVDLLAVNVDWGTTGAWGVRMPYYDIWYWQVQPIEFCATVENIGLTDIDSAVYEVSIPTASFSASSAVSIPVGEVDTICLMNTFTPNSTIASIDVSHTISSNLTEQNVVNNNIDDASFTLWEYWSQPYTRDTYDPTSQGGQGGAAQGGIDGSELCEYEVGNVFDIFQDQSMYGMEVWIDPSTPVGTELSARVYKYDTLTNDFVFIEFTFIYTVVTSDLGNLVELDFAGNSIEPFLAGNSYLITASVYGGLCGGPSSIFGLSGKSKPNTSFFIDLSNGTMEMSYLTETPIVRLVTPPEIHWGLGEGETEVQVEIYPNPTNKSAVISFELMQPSNLKLSVYDLSGKLIGSEHRKNQPIGKGELVWNTSNLQSGAYLVEIITDFGSTTKRIIVQH